MAKVSLNGVSKFYGKVQAVKKIDLENFGKPYGYLERQIKLWIKQYRDSETKHIKSMEYLINTIPKYIPTEIDL